MKPTQTLIDEVISDSQLINDLIKALYEKQREISRRLRQADNCNICILEIPNKITLEALEELESDKESKTFNSVDELFEDLLGRK